MEVGDFLGDGEAEAEAADLLAELFGGEIGFEDAREVFRGNTGAGIDDLDAHAAAGQRSGAERDGPAGRGRVEGVLHQVHEQALQKDAVAGERDGSRHGEHKIDAAGVRGRPDGVVDAAEKVRGVERFEMGLQPAGEEMALADVVGHQPHGAAGISVNLALRGAGREAVLGMDKERGDGGDEVLEVVREAARHQGEVGHARFEGGLRREAGAGEQAGDEVGDVLEALDLAVGVGMAGEFPAETENQRRGVATGRGRNQDLEAMLAHELLEVGQRGRRPGAEQRFVAGPTDFAEGLQTGTREIDGVFRREERRGGQQGPGAAELLP